MDFLRQILSRIQELWSKWSVPQKVVLIGIVIAVVGGLAVLFSVSSKPTMVAVFDAPIRDEALLDRIILRINEEGEKANVNAAGIVQVADERVAKRMRAILIREDLLPQGINPWEVFDKERWTLTDIERNTNKQRAQTRLVTDHINAIDDVDNAVVSIVWPADKLFVSDQNPVTASVTITPKPGSDITENGGNRKKIEGIQKILKFAIEGLKDEYIVITDRSGLVLNDFEGMAAIDRQALVERETKFVLQTEAKYRAIVLAALQQTFGADRVRDINIKFDIDMSKISVEREEFLPIMLKERTPGLPYDDSERVQSITRSSSTSTTTWEGTGYTPEGPPGREGQTPPSMRDMSNLYGRMSQETNTQNEELNRKFSQEERSPQIGRVTVAVNIDGTWKRKYDEKNNPVILADGSIEREYTPIDPQVLREATALVQDAIGFSAARGDSVTVRNIQYDRTQQFKDEDAAYFRKKQMQTTILVFLSGLTILLLSFIIFRMVSREMERRRRLAEEERSRREQMLRESAIANAEEEGVDVSISVEERTRLELLESVANMAKEHPEDCAQLIRTWLLEE